MDTSLLREFQLDWKLSGKAPRTAHDYVAAVLDLLGKYPDGGSVTHGNVKCPSVETEGAPVIKSWYSNLSRGATLNKARLSECGIQMGDLKELSQVAAHSEGDAAVANTTSD